PPARHARHAGAAAQGGPRRAAQPREGAPASRRPPPRPMRGGAAPSSGARADLLSQPAVHRGDGSCRGWTEPPLAKRGGGALSIPDPGGDRGRNTSAAARELSELRSRFVDRSSSIDRCTVRPPRYSPSKGAALRARVSACKAQSGGVWRKLNAYVSICCWPLRGVEGCSLEARATEAARSQRSAVHCGERGRRARSSPSE
ncbi:unnamed protein product, partial [Prorocentrum cordatum]